MNNDKRIFAFLSLGLFLTACLAPFIIAVLGVTELAIGFGTVAGLLALLFGALSWSERIGKTVTIVLLSILVVGGVFLPAISTLRMRAYVRPQPAEALQR